MRRGRVLSAIAGAAVAASLFVLSALPAAGADTGTINAKVTVASPCVTVALAGGFTSVLDFGTRRFGYGVSQGNTHTVKNCGADLENVYVRGTDAKSETSATTWALTNQRPAPTNAYNLNVYDSSVGGTNNLDLTTSNQLWRAMNGGDTDTLGSGIALPPTGSDGAGEVFTMQIVYTASF